MVKFSFIVPFYNGSRYIEATINSILNQVFDNFELILIDDASSGNEKNVLCDLLASINSDKITLINNSVNLGLMSSLNTGVSHSRGEYIIILGQDDLVSPTHLDSLNQFILSIGQCFSAIFCDAVYIAGDNKTDILVRGRRLDKFKNGYIDFASLMRWNYVVSVGICIHKKSLEQVGGFDATFISHGEWLTWLKLATSGKIYINRSILSEYRRHESNLTSSIVAKGALQKFHYDEYVNSFALHRSNKSLFIRLTYVFNKLKNRLYFVYRKMFNKSLSHLRVIKN